MSLYIFVHYAYLTTIPNATWSDIWGAYSVNGPVYFGSCMIKKKMFHQCRWIILQLMWCSIHKSTVVITRTQHIYFCSLTDISADGSDRNVQNMSSKEQAVLRSHSRPPHMKKCVLTWDICLWTNVVSEMQRNIKSRGG